MEIGKVSCFCWLLWSFFVYSLIRIWLLITLSWDPLSAETRFIVLFIVYPRNVIVLFLLTKTTVWILLLFLLQLLPSMHLVVWLMYWDFFLLSSCKVFSLKTQRTISWFSVFRSTTDVHQEENWIHHRALGNPVEGRLGWFVLPVRCLICVA